MVAHSANRLIDIHCKCREGDSIIAFNEDVTVSLVVDNDTPTHKTANIQSPLRVHITNIFLPYQGQPLRKDIIVQLLISLNKLLDRQILIEVLNHGVSN